MRGDRVLGASWLATVAAVAVVLAAGPAASGSIEEPVAPRTPSRTEPREASEPAPPIEAVGDHFTDAAPVVATRSLPQRFEPHVLVRVPRPLAARARPSGEARVVGTVVASSKYYHVPLVVWAEKVSSDGRWGLVEIPYVWPRREGWIKLEGLRRSSTAVEVRIDLSRRRITVYRRSEPIFGFQGAIGAPVSPTPPGEYVVTDRIAFARGGYLGSFAFGISGIQPNLPPGWSGGNQLAVHGTNDPSSIGRSVSAGCVRVSEAALARLKPLLQLGTPVLITR
jgi:hypothetical protein